MVVVGRLRVFQDYLTILVSDSFYLNWSWLGFDDIKKGFKSENLGWTCSWCGFDNLLFALCDLCIIYIYYWINLINKIRNILKL